MSELTQMKIKKTPFRWRKLLFNGGALAGFVLCMIASYAYWNDWSHARQMQEDPRVARVWELGVTQGETHTLRQGSELQLRLNRANIHWLGDFSVLNSRFSGDPLGVEIWFGYQSYVPKRPELICHRVGTAAFTDDLGQTYHGFLDLHGSVVGVYLPGYDRAARKLFCNLHWMPEEVAGERNTGFISQPMSFTIELPQMKRSLPTLSDLGSEGVASSALNPLEASNVPGNSPGARKSISEVTRSKVTQTKNGVTVMIGEARLSAPKLRNLYEGQRDLLFRLNISGGKLANDNVSDIVMPRIQMQGAPFSFQMQNDLQQRKLNARIQALIRRNLRERQGGAPDKEVPTLTFSPLAPLRVDKSLTMIDPYGVSLNVKDGIVTPLTSVESSNEAADKGILWRVPVTGAGKSTDVIRVHLDVRPDSKDSAGQPLPAIPYDLLIPVQTGDEI